MFSNIEPAASQVLITQSAIQCQGRCICATWQASLVYSWLRPETLIPSATIPTFFHAHVFFHVAKNGSVFLHPPTHLFSENEARARGGAGVDTGRAEQDNLGRPKGTRSPIYPLTLQEAWMGIERRVIPTLQVTDKSWPHGSRLEMDREKVVPRLRESRLLT